jgi:hypothetical protein
MDTEGYSVRARATEQKRAASVRGGRLGEGGSWTVEPDARQPVQADRLDQRADLGLGASQQDGAPVGAQTAREPREVEHQRRVGEHELAEVDDDVGLRSDRPRQRPSAPALRRAILVSAAAQGGRLVIEIDDARNVLKTADCWQERQ